MGVIKDGSISGVLPSSNEAFAVYFPGYPSSIERAIQTLGGNEGILKARTDKSNNLELRLRPEDPYSHPAFGRLRSCNSYLLKISKKKVKDVQNREDLNRISEQGATSAFHAEQNSSFHKITETLEQIVQPGCESLSASAEIKALKHNGSQEQLSADIVAQVSEAYDFNGMVDYQHVVALHTSVNQRKKRNWAEVEPQLGEGGLMDVNQEDSMILVPPLFSTKTRPNQLILKQGIDMSMKKKPEGVVQKHSEVEMEHCLAIDFNIKEIPKKVNWKDFTPENSDRWKWQEAVCTLFDERPVWVKDSLVERLVEQGHNIGYNMLRRLLYITAYYFSNGPFLRFYIRKGYDPRKDPESRIYQRTDFRVHPSLRSYCDTYIASGLTNRWEDICAFRVFPYKCQTSFQLNDLKDDYIQQEIRKPASQQSCNPQTGWFSSQVIDSLRLRVAQRFLSVYPEAGAEFFLKSVSRRFEKSKRVHISMKDSKIVEDKQANKDVLESENKEYNDEAEYAEEDEEEEEEVDGDEMEDDHLGEDLDADEALDLVDGDIDFALGPHSYTGHENISKDYLQELFGSFPLTSDGGDGMKDTNPFDEEFQIYEQYSDRDYSEDEDY